MKNKLIVGLLTVFSSIMLANSVFAWSGGRHGGGSGGPPPVVPEPMSCLLFIASGGTYAAMRYMRARRRSRNLDKEIREINEGM